MKPWPLSSVLKRFDVLAATDQGLQCADMLQLLRCSALVVCKSHVLINKGKLLAAVSMKRGKHTKKGVGCDQRELNQQRRSSLVAAFKTSSWLCSNEGAQAECLCGPACSSSEGKSKQIQL